MIARSDLGTLTLRRDATNIGEPCPDVDPRHLAMGSPLASSVWTI